jgi:REP element-mobilizing transposase RayT
LWTSNAKRHSIGVVAYCFLPNHFHFLLRPLADNKGSGFMNSLFGSYVRALNRQMR